MLDSACAHTKHTSPARDCAASFLHRAVQVEKTTRAKRAEFRLGGAGGGTGSLTNVRQFRFNATNPPRSRARPLLECR